MYIHILTHGVSISLPTCLVELRCFCLGEDGFSSLYDLLFPIWIIRKGKSYIINKKKNEKHMFAFKLWKEAMNTYGRCKFRQKKYSHTKQDLLHRRDPLKRKLYTTNLQVLVHVSCSFIGMPYNLSKLETL